MVKLLTTQQAAASLGISTGRVRQLVLAGRIAGVQHLTARMLLIPEKSLEAVRTRKAGRPRRKK